VQVILALLLALALALPFGADAAKRGGSGGSHARSYSSGSHSHSTGARSSRRAGSSQVRASNHAPRSSAVRSSGSHSGKGHTSTQRSNTRASTLGIGSGQRDAKVRFKRDPRARAEFQRSHPCPSTGKTSGACPRYVVDHVTPLKRLGADHPSNMQWQTSQSAKAKDRTE